MDIAGFFSDNFIFLILFAGLIIFSFYERNIPGRAKVILFSVFILSFFYLLAQSFEFRSRMDADFDVIRLICGIFILSVKPVMILLFYFLISSKNKIRLWLWTLPAVNFILTLISICTQYDPEMPSPVLTFSSDNTVIRGMFLFSSIIVPTVILFITAVEIIIRYKDTPVAKTVVVLFIIISCIGASVIEMLGGDVTVFSSAMCISLTFYYLYIYASENKKQNQQMMEQNQMDLMISQIQPHFLYNTLNSIYHLCDIDPQLAKNTIDDFSSYLRNNLNSLNSTELIPFSKDLEHAKNYLDIEKLRFGDRVNVKYDIQISDFEVLPLTLQPLVENAVKHGICEKEEGGTVLIKTYEEFNDIIIQIKDDGVGFDVTKLDSSSRKHIGFNNVKNRVEKILHGRFGVQSEPGKGTTVTITLKRSGK